MEQNKLTNFQKEKLLEMCIELFPDYQFVEYDENFNDLYEGLIRFKKDKPYESSILHYYELCLKHIVNKLQLEYVSVTVLTEENPIDYLYEKYLKIKESV